MECDRFEILHKVVGIASCTALDYPRSVKGILRYLTHTFQLEEARFLFFDPPFFSSSMLDMLFFLLFLLPQLPHGGCG
jgi:hypothetical protein